jgi:flagellar basal-body rod protein FlgC
MDLLDTFGITGSGLTAQRVRLQTVASNMANARTTKTEDGGPYRRRMPGFQAEQIDRFGDALERNLARVKITGIQQSDDDLVQVYDPGHPDADEEGYVLYPNVNILNEMVDLMTTSRTYEANVNVLDATKQMARRALDIGR